MSSTEKCENTIIVRWVTKESQSEDLAKTAATAGATVSEKSRWEPGPNEMDDYGDASFEPLTVVVAVIAAGWLITRIGQLIEDHNHPDGQLIDTTKKEILVRPLPKMYRGTLVLVTKRGTEVFPPERRDEALQILAQVVMS